MTNLTEQGKTHYYIKLPNNEVIIGDEFALSLYRNCKDGDKIEVLDEVPSYELWKAVHEQWKVLLEENTKLKETISNDIFLIKSRDSEIVKLKELLKECAKGFSKVRSANLIYPIELDELRDEIDQVLGEE